MYRRIRGIETQKQIVPRADKKKSRWIVKYSAVYVNRKTHSDLRMSQRKNRWTLNMPSSN
jgi:hypothetical protein